MTAPLHITNGDVAAELIRRAGLARDVLPWRDVLHEGPVPAGLTLEAMSEERAKFIGSCGWGDEGDVRRGFEARDRALRGASHVVLWFEHDLYDQLQLIQILSALRGQPETEVELICIGEFPGIAPFYGLGQLTAEQISSLWPKRSRVAAAQFSLADRAWQAFSASEPAMLAGLLEEDLSALPFLRAALERLREEYPAPQDGLSRTERQILAAVSVGASTFEAVFQQSQQREAAPYLGDSALRRHLDRLQAGASPLLTAEPLRVTAAGKQVLAGERNECRLNGIDRWIGGVHIVHVPEN
jgi:hypothetical protein